MIYKQNRIQSIDERFKKAIVKFFLPKNIKNYSWSIVRFVIIFGLCFTILYPLIIKILNSFMSPDDFIDPTVRYIPRNFTLYYIKMAIDKISYFSSLKTTASLSLIVASIQLIICTMAGYGFARFKFKGREILFALVVLILLIPPQTIMSSLFMYFRFFNFFGLELNLIDSYWPFILLSTTGLGLRNGLYIYLTRQFFRGFPVELEEAAYIDGCGTIKTFTAIMLPNARVMMVTVFVFSFSWQWTDIFYTNIFFNRLITLSKSVILNIQFVYTDPIEFSVLRNVSSVLIIIPLLILFIFLQRKLIQGIEKSGIVG